VQPAGPSAAFREALEKHKQMVTQLETAESQLEQAASQYGRANGKYVTALLQELGIAKAPSTSIKLIAEMADERDRIATDLRGSLKAVCEALVRRAQAEETYLIVETALWDLEAQAVGGRTAAARLAEEEVKQLRDAEISLHVAQKAQQQAYIDLLEHEYDATATLAEDLRARDRIDRQLAEQRTTLDQRFAKLIDAAREYDAASGRIHAKLLPQIPEREKLLVARGKALLAERASAATAIGEARAALKDAILKRAEDRLREIDHDAEIHNVLDGVKPQIRDAVVAKVVPVKEEAGAQRVEMRNSESFLGDIRKKLVTLEADITALGY
jgi:hypothetical protein